MLRTEKKHSIIIIDDDKFLLDMYSLKFSKAGFEIRTAQSGIEAIRIISEEKYQPDIIILDVVMPGMGGLEFLEKARNENLIPNSVVIVLTNQGQPSDIKRAEELGVDGYIVKATAIPSEVLDEVVKIFNKNKK